MMETATNDVVMCDLKLSIFFTVSLIFLTAASIVTFPIDCIHMVQCHVDYLFLLSLLLSDQIMNNWDKVKVSSLD